MSKHAVRSGNVAGLLDRLLIANVGEHANWLC
jgi:hypothetical protein